MADRRFVVMGAGGVGFNLARDLAACDHGYDVSVIEMHALARERIEESLDVSVVAGNGAHVPVLAKAGVDGCDLFVAASSDDEANLAACLLAKRLGAERCVARVGVSEDVVLYRRIYQDAFSVDLLLSTQLLSTTRLLNRVLDRETMEVEYLAGGKVQLRKVHLHHDSPLTGRPLRDVALPRDCLVVAFFRGDELIIPGGDDQARGGDEALILGRSGGLATVEQMVKSRVQLPETVVIAGGGRTGTTVAKSLESFPIRIKIIERDRTRARELAAIFPRFQILHGDATDLPLLRSEGIDEANSFVAMTGQDESNLMASLLVQELGVRQILPLVDRVETSNLWRKLGLEDVFSPRALATERILRYIENGFSETIVSLQRGKAVVLERILASASPAAGVTLAEMRPPRGLIVGAVVRGEKVFVPRGPDRLEVGDLVILFVHEEELDTVNLLFPGRND